MPYVLHSIPDSIPSFVQNNYPLFKNLLESYYEYLYKNTDAKLLLDEHRYIVSDISMDNYIEKLKDELGLDIPHIDNINIDILTKFLNFLLSKRGSESGLKGFFKLAFNDDVIITYPHQLLLIPSNTQNIITNYCLIKSEIPITTNVYSLYGYSSGTKGDIEKINTFVYNNEYYSLIEFYSNHELKINERVDINGEVIYKSVNVGIFTPEILDGGKLYKKGDIITFPNAIIQGEIEVSSVKNGEISFSIVDGGNNYKVGDAITSIPNNGFYAKIKSVGDIGQISEIEIINDGRGFDEIPEIVIHSKEGKNSKLQINTMNVGAIDKLKILQPIILPLGDNTPYTYSEYGNNVSMRLKHIPQYKIKRFLNNNHKLGINGIILDSNNLHLQSYNIITDIDIRHWKKFVDKYFHRSGYIYKHINPIISETKINKKISSKVI